MRYAEIIISEDYCRTPDKTWRASRFDFRPTLRARSELSRAPALHKPTQDPAVAPEGYILENHLYILYVAVYPNLYLCKPLSMKHTHSFMRTHAPDSHEAGSSHCQKVYRSIGPTGSNCNPSNYRHGCNVLHKNHEIGSDVQGCELQGSAGSNACRRVHPCPSSFMMDWLTVTTHKYVGARTPRRISYSIAVRISFFGHHTITKWFRNGVFLQRL